MPSRTVAALVAALALAAASTAEAATYRIDPGHSAVTFQIRHFVSQVHGRFDRFSGTVVKDDENPAASSVEFSLDAASIDTNQERRDADLRGPDFFDVGRYPEIRFVSKRVEPLDDGRYRVTGDLTIRDVTREVELPVEFAGEMDDGRGGARAGFFLTTELNRKDYGIVWNRVLDTGGTMVGDEVRVVISLEAIRN